MVRRSKQERRSGAAAAEFAVVMAFVLIPMLFGTWELGRLVFVKQVVANSAREGARLAAQGLTINDNGTQTLIVAQIPPASNPNRLPNVKAAVHQSLAGAGFTNLTWDDVTVVFQFLDPPLDPLPMPPPPPAKQPAPVGGEPWQGIKGQRFMVSVSIPFAKVRYPGLGLANPTTVSHAVEWRMLVDDEFNINTNLPPW